MGVYTIAGQEWDINVINRAPPLIQKKDGRLIVHWPDPKPETFEARSEWLDGLIAKINGDA